MQKGSNYFGDSLRHGSHDEGRRKGANLPFGVIMLLDDSTSFIVRQAQQAIIDATITQEIGRTDIPPHITLAVSEKLDVSLLKRQLEDIAAGLPILNISFTKMNTFPTEPAVLYLAPVVTRELIHLHFRVHRMFSECANALWEYYLPDRWVPHCTIAEKLPTSLVEQARDLCQSIELPLEGKLDQMALVEFYPVRYKCSFRLIASLDG